MWEDFLKQIRLKSIETKWDFKVEWHWKMSVDKEVMSIEFENETKTFRRKNDTSRIYIPDNSCQI